MTLVHIPSLPVVRSRNQNRGGFSQPHVSPWLTPLAYWLGCKVVLPAYLGQITITGQAHIPRDGAVILAPTHRSRWDALMLPLTAGRVGTGRDVHFMVSSDEMQGLQGWVIHRLGGFPIDTKRPGLSSIRCGVDILQRGQMLVVFPEGDIFRDGQVHPLKVGLARMALQAASDHHLPVAIVPIGIHYSTPNVKRGTDIQIEVGHPLLTSSYDDWPVKQGAQRLTTDLKAALETL